MFNKTHGIPLFLKNLALKSKSSLIGFISSLNSSLMDYLTYRGSYLSKKQKQEIAQKIKETLKKHGYTHTIIGFKPHYFPMEEGIDRVIGVKSSPASLLESIISQLIGASASSTIPDQPLYLGNQTYRNKYLYRKLGKHLKSKELADTFRTLTGENNRRVLYINFLPQLERGTEAAILAHEIGHNLNTELFPTISGFRFLSAGIPREATVNEYPNKLGSLLLKGAVTGEEAFATYTAWNLLKNTIPKRDFLAMIPAWGSYVLHNIDPYPVYQRTISTRL